MRVLLVKPVTPGKLVLNCIPPIGLGYLATSLRRAGFRGVEILDCVKEGWDYQDFQREVEKRRPDVVGFQTFSQDLPSLSKSLKIVKRIDPKAVTIAGGPHPSGLPRETLRDFRQLDFLFCGEAERGLPKLVGALQAKKDFAQIPGLGWRDAKGRVRVNSQIFIENLDSLSFPAWDLFPPQEYPDAPQGAIFRNLPVAPLVATRGCPFSCTFCAGWTISGKRVRRRSVGNVLAEIELLYRDYDIREIHFLDDNFTLDRDYVEEFCQELLKKDFRISWCCPNGVRLDTLDKRILRLMKKAGCYYVSVGLESGSDRILRLMKKGTTVSKIRKMVRTVNETGMTINGFFILGYPGESKKEALETIQLARSLDLTRAAFYNFLPLPRSEAYENLLKSGEISKAEIDWTHIFQADVPYSPGTMTRKELKNLQRRAHLKFYLRPKILWRLLREIRTPQQLGYILRRGEAYLIG